MRRLWAGVAAVGILTLWTTPAHADSIRDSEWMIDALMLPEAHQIATGEGVTVGIVDTGIDSTHPDLTGTVIAGKDSWSPNKDGQTDATGHGTAMASLIAGHGHGTDNAEGILGVAPAAKILSYGAWKPGNQKYDDTELLKGIRWVIDNGADIILLAYGGGTSEPEEEALIEEAAAKGIPIISPTANAVAGEDALGFPGTFAEVTVAACTNRDGEYSEVGLKESKVSLAAPCEDVVTAWQNGGYDDTSGTSKASAVAAGAFALVKSYWPDISLEDLYKRIKVTLDDKGEPGHDSLYGYGVINPLRALTEHVEPVDPSNPPHDLSDMTSPSAPAATLGAATEKSNSTPLIVAGVIAGAAIVGIVLLVVLKRRSA